MFNNYQILEIQKAIRHFLWPDGKGNRKPHVFNRDWCHADKTLSGLGLKDLKLQGISLSTKKIFYSLEGDSDVGASRKKTVQRKAPRIQDEKMQSKRVNWHVLKPIMAYESKRFHKLCNGFDNGPRTKFNVIRSIHNKCNVMGKMPCNG